MLFEVRALAASQRISLKAEAADIADATGQVRLQGLTVLNGRPAGNFAGMYFSRRSRFPVSLFSRELLALLRSGLALVEAIQTLEEKESRPETRKILSGVLGRLYEGESFSSAIEHFPEAFPARYVATVRAAERTSDLPQALSRYVAYQDQVEQVPKKAWAASIYPLLLIVVGTLVALFLLGFVTPRFASIYADNVGVDLGSGLIERIHVTPGNVTDGDGFREVCPTEGLVLADKAYDNGFIRGFLQQRGCEDGLIRKNAKTEEAKARNRELSKRRSPCRSHVHRIRQPMATRRLRTGKPYGSRAAATQICCASIGECSIGC